MSYSLYDRDGNTTLSVDPQGRATQTQYNGDDEATTVTVGQWDWTTTPAVGVNGVGGFTGTVETTESRFDPAGQDVADEDGVRERFDVGDEVLRRRERRP